MPGAAHPIGTVLSAAAAGLPLAWAGDGGGVPQLIAVRACGAGWQVHAEAFKDILFASGAAAERAARRLALAIAETGTDAKVNVYDARGALVAAIEYFAGATPPGAKVFRHYPWAD
ncbi:MAG TPA: hypothetical protein VF495_14430 [Phenylobacterium sp.]